MREFQRRPRLTGTSIRERSSIWERLAGLMDQSFSAGSGKKSHLDPPAMTLDRAAGLRPCLLGYSRPKHRNSKLAGRSSGLRLVAASERPSRVRLKGAGHSGLPCSEASPITAAAPQRIRTVFPILPRLIDGREEPVKTSNTATNPMAKVQTIRSQSRH